MVGGGEVGFSTAEGLCRGPGDRDAHAVHPTRTQALELFDAWRVLRRDAPKISRNGHCRRRRLPPSRPRQTATAASHARTCPKGRFRSLRHGQFASGEAAAGRPAPLAALPEHHDRDRDRGENGDRDQDRDERRGAATVTGLRSLDTGLVLGAGLRVLAPGVGAAAWFTLPVVAAISPRHGAFLLG